MNTNSAQYDAVIVGGGPAGSTAGTFLKKYNPSLNVLILEKERFPRDHVGESQLPPISIILDEMGCWDKVEAANFPIKIGASYRWGRSPELWHFDFYPTKDFVDEPRPAKFEGQRKATAFQVDRAIYDEILLNHAQEMGCEVRQETLVRKVHRDGDAVTGIELEDGSVVQARYYLDASGHAGIMRKALGVRADSPTTLQNIAIWDYWQNADWAYEIGTGGTRVQVMSLGYGWIWFIPLGPTRTSVGLIVPASYYKECGLSKEELYAKALKEDPLISKLMTKAVSENNLQATKDWSFLADRHVGPNWFLIGECAGFADPILAAGLTLAQSGAREAAYTIHELDRGKHKADWLKEQYQTRQLQRIGNHIRFADYWYTANSQFKDLKDFTQTIASDNGFEMTPEESWRWLAQGGFISETVNVGQGGYALDQMKAGHEIMMGEKPTSILATTNVFKLDLSGAQWQERAVYHEGRITKMPGYVRNGRPLPLTGSIQVLVDMLQLTSKLPELLQMMDKLAQHHSSDRDFMQNVVLAIPMTLEALISDGWVQASYDPNLPLVPPPDRGTGVAWDSELAAV